MKASRIYVPDANPQNQLLVRVLSDYVKSSMKIFYVIAVRNVVEIPNQCSMFHRPKTSSFT